MGDFYNGYENDWEQGSGYGETERLRQRRYLPGYGEHENEKYYLPNYSQTAREVSSSTYVLRIELVGTWG